MERTKGVATLNLPDAINCSITKDFTQIHNNLLRNPEISGKAKSILFLLISNREGWKSHIIAIKNNMKEGEEAIRSGLLELEKHGYLIRLRYRDKITKSWKGSFWAYTDLPHRFVIQNQFDYIEKSGLEIPSLEEPDNPQVGNPNVANPEVENHGLKILIYKNNKLEKEQIIYISNFKDFNGQPNSNSKGEGITPSQFEKFWELWHPARRGSKGKTITSWEKICNRKGKQSDRPTWQRIRAALIQQKKCKQWQDTLLIPLASTWLNNKRWLDDPKELKRYNFEDTGESKVDPDQRAREDRLWLSKFGHGE